MRALVVDPSALVRQFLMFWLGRPRYGYTGDDAPPPPKMGPAEMHRRIRQLVERKPRYIQVSEAASEWDAIKLMAQIEFDLVVSAIDLKLMDAAEMMATHRKSHSSQPRVILTTCESSLEVHDRAKAANAVCLLHRPISSTDLYDAVRTALCLGDILPPPPGGTRRKAPRLPNAIALTLTGAIEGSFTTWDVSPYGAFVLSEERQTMGARAEALIKLPYHQKAVSTPCRVVHIRTDEIGSMPRGFGLSFDHENTPVSEAVLAAFQSPA